MKYKLNIFNSVSTVNTGWSTGVYILVYCTAFKVAIPKMIVKNPLYKKPYKHLNTMLRQLSTVVNWPEFKANHSSPSNAEVVNAWTLNSMTPIFCHGIGIRLKSRAIFYRVTE
jgi:hypothetical protein